MGCAKCLFRMLDILLFQCAHKLLHYFYILYFFGVVIFILFLLYITVFIYF